MYNFHKRNRARFCASPENHVATEKLDALFAIAGT